MGTSLKLVDASGKGKKVRCLTQETSNAWHVSFHRMLEIIQNLLQILVKYLCLGKIQSDRLEAEFGVIRQLIGGNYLITVEQVLSSLSQRKLKLYHKSQT